MTGRLEKADSHVSYLLDASFHIALPPLNLAYSERLMTSALLPGHSKSRSIVNNASSTKKASGGRHVPVTDLEALLVLIPVPPISK